MEGDFNVVNQDINIANPKPNRRNVGFTDEERDNFTKLLDSGYLDTFRVIYLYEKIAIVGGVI